MINEKNQEKAKKFFQVVAAMQNNRGQEIGLLVIKKETLEDLTPLFENSNRVMTIDLASADIDNIINDLAEGVKNGLTFLIRLYDYLDPRIFNQLFLLAKANHLEFPKFEDRIFVDAAKGTNIILISTDKELEKLNYKNIFDIVALTERF